MYGYPSSLRLIQTFSLLPKERLDEDIKLNLLLNQRLLSLILNKTRIGIK